MGISLGYGRPADEDEMISLIRTAVELGVALGLGLAAGLAFGSTGRAQGAEPVIEIPAWPTPLHRAVWLARVRPYTPEGRAIQAARAAHRDPRAEFDAALAEIGRGPAALPAEFAADPVALRLVEIAAERLRAPGNFELVFKEQIYLRDEARAQSAPPLPNDLLRPELRLVWEDLLLGPSPKGAAPWIEVRALGALAAVGDPRSLVVLEHRFQMTTRKGVNPEEVGTEQLHLLDSLWRFPGGPGAALLLRFIDAALPPEGAGARPANAPSLDVRVYALERFSGEAERGIRRPWQKAILECAAPPEARPAVSAFLTELKARAASMPVIGE